MCVFFQIFDSILRFRYMTASLQGAFTFVGHGGDALLRILLFWSLFLPCGEVSMISFEPINL
jgi:hypothetical protein